MQKPEYLSNDVAACIASPALAFALAATGAYFYCGWVLVLGA
jgi:hypothetical protein